MSKPRRFYRDVDGILLLDKPLGLSSNAALQQARGLFGARKAGHAGSLDPLASGLLPICFGQATKVCGRLLDARKTYRVTVQLGARTESLDGETDIVERAPVPALSDSSIDMILAGFLGQQQQIPPMHSALKHQGQRLYELARRGQSIDRPPRQIEIYRIERCQLRDDRLEFEVACSKGTYIRSLAADIAARAGTLGYLTDLRRLSVDPFAGYPMQDLTTLRHLSESGQGALDGLLLRADIAFADLSSVTLDAEAVRAMLLGQQVRVAAEPVAAGSSLRAYDGEGVFLGLVEGLPDGRVRPVRLFVDATGSSCADSGRAEPA